MFKCGLRIFDPGWKNLTCHVLFIVSFCNHTQLLAVQSVQSLAVHHVHLREPTVRDHSLHVTLPLVLCNSHRVNCGRHCVCWMIVNDVLERWRNHRMFFSNCLVYVLPILVDSYKLDTTGADEVHPEVIGPMSLVLFHARDYAVSDVSTRTCDD